MRRQADDFSAILSFLNTFLGCLGGIVVGLALVLLGGSWLAVPVCAAVGMAAGRFLAIDPPDGFWRAALDGCLAVRFLPRMIRITCSLALVGAVAVADALTGDAVPIFYVYTVAIFLSSLLLGKHAAVAAWLSSLAMVAYFVIPPKDSFAIATLRDLASLVIFIAAGAITLAVPLLQFASSFLANEKARRLARQ